MFIHAGVWEQALRAEAIALTVAAGKCGAELGAEHSACYNMHMHMLQHAHAHVTTCTCTCYNMHSCMQMYLCSHYLLLRLPRAGSDELVVWSAYCGYDYALQVE